MPQLNFAKENGIQIYIGDPKEQVPGKNIVLPSHPSLVSVTDMSMEDLRNSYLRNALKKLKENQVEDIDVKFLAEEVKMSKEEIVKILKQNNIEIG